MAINRIQSLFQAKQKNVLSIYFTAGYPKLNNTTEIIKELAYSGVDFIEIGIPFSDPMADGPTIQQSGEAALRNGMSLNLLFEQLEGIRKEVNIPLLLMGYLNPIYQFGIERFCKRCAEVGIDGVIIPDLPLREYETEYRKYFQANGIENVFLISPMTAPERIRQIDSLCSSFIYMVSSSAITGARHQISPEQEAYFKRIDDMQLKNPRVIGFGISNHETYQVACTHACGAIIGSAFVKMLGEESSGTLKTRISSFVKSIRG